MVIQVFFATEVNPTEKALQDITYGNIDVYWKGQDSQSKVREAAQKFVFL